jgi:flagellar operon protein
VTDPLRSIPGGHAAGGVGAPRPAGGTPAGGRAPAEAAPAERAPAERARFGDVLAARVRASEPATAGPLKFSGHALERIQRRGIELDAGALGRLEAGVARAAGKGSRDSLVLLDDTAFVVSVRNRTVVTAVDREHMRQQVFTNIDSAVIA